jgi:hypothetical protein
LRFGRELLPDKWSVGEIIAHLAEDELVNRWRYRQMIESSGCSHAGFDQDVWARIGNYASWKPSDAQLPAWSIEVEAVA